MLNILLVIIGSIAYGFLPIFVKNIIAYNYSSLSIVFYRYFLTAIFLFIIIIVSKKSFKITKRQFIELLIFSIIGLGLTFFFLSQSLLYISAGLSNMIHFGYPVIVLLVMIFMFKEKANILKVLSIVFAIVGIVMLTQVVEVESFLGVVYALITTITYGSYIIANKKCSFAEVDTMVSLFYMSLFVSITFFIVGMFTGSLQLLNNLYVFGNFAIISLVCTIFSLGLLLYGVKRLGSSLASILNMFEPATTVVASIFIYKEELTINIIIGSILIILSTISMVIGSKK
ncbi:transmembrane protein [Brachyspira intermedia PWS/A]|uniref:Transmembrane protein n=1 Tax=Brachyspira intermedia (strain ATCC 51140 / PWS/A) TaxID=1045858 RepID=G0EM44_BRAIP|nr:DMT family transporter [Brachyspira intermedia]AEM21613.1 transmembrane protein [Brachyspira intermedia PWS/A]